MHEPSHTYQYVMHTNILKDASEKRAAGQTVPRMLRAYKFVKHANTDAACVHANVPAHRRSLCPLLINVLQVG